MSRASLAGELKRSWAGQIEEPEIDRVLAVAENEVWLAGARRRLRRNLDRDGVGELGCRGRRRRRFLREGVLFGLPVPPPGATSSSPNGSLRAGAWRRLRRRRLPLPPPEAREATARSFPFSPRSCRAIERGSAIESAS